jgi:hypothetical protein
MVGTFFRGAEFMQIEIEEKYLPAVLMLLARLRRSESPELIEKNGDWSHYSETEVFEAVAGEFDEYREAMVIGRVEGPHGQVDELCDLAVVAVKGAMRLGRDVGCGAWDVTKGENE